MGSLNVKLIKSRNQLNDFTRELLRDIHAIELMLEKGWFNDAPLHIGAEQELCLVDRHSKPAPLAMSVLEQINDPDFTTELARFNLEVNLPPIELGPDTLRILETTLREKLEHLSEVCTQNDINFVLTGILPSIRKSDLGKENLTPLNRYDALMESIKKMRGSELQELHITGLDELHIKHDSAMLESGNTSFQLHYQVAADQFVSQYNIAQVLAGPVLAIGTNSPLLFGKRLWSETRIALFQQSVDTRLASEHIRERAARVMFGTGWLKNSIMELYQEDISRFRVLLTCLEKEDVEDKIARGVTPNLYALAVHNGTVYRWNRACYGISSNGKPHLRIENRVLPAGPTVTDEMANAAFWIGLMHGFSEFHPDVTKSFDFDHVKENFISAARNGLHTDFNWAKGRKYNTSTLIREELLDIARFGLEKAGVHDEDIRKNLDVIAERNETKRTGSAWLVKSFNYLKKTIPKEEIPNYLVSSIIRNRKDGIPVHKWPFINIDSIVHQIPDTMLVEEFMTTDVFTVNQDDIIEFVTEILNWRGIKYAPVEDNKGRLQGLITYRELLDFYSRFQSSNGEAKKIVKDLMIKNPVTIRPESSIREAVELMQKHNVTCLPVVKDTKLLGIVSEGDYIGLMKTLLTEKDKS